MAIDSGSHKMYGKAQGELVASADSVDAVTDGLAEVILTACDSNQYIEAFKAIVSLEEEIRGMPLSWDEIRVTKELAGPFITGGLMILLENPRDSHPWSQGTVAVINECRTFGALEEALQIVSNKALNLINGVSVVDVRAFYKSNFKPTTEQEKKIEDLVFEAIRAKQPEVMLCMGDTAKGFFSPHENRLCLDLGSPVPCFYSIHPSRSLHNQNKDCPWTRQKLLDNIRRAFEALEGREHDLSPNRELDYLHPHPSSFIPAANDCAAQINNFKVIREFLHTLAELCFHERYKLPLLGVGIEAQTRWSYFAFKKCHIKLLRHTLLCGGTILDVKYATRATIIPLFMRLNLSLTSISYFPADRISAYEVNWNEVSRVMAGAPADLEQICDQLANADKDSKGDMFPLASPFNITLVGIEHEHMRILERMVGITRHIQKILSYYGRGRRHRSVNWLGPADTCKCLGNHAISDEQIRSTFSNAYIKE